MNGRNERRDDLAFFQLIAGDLNVARRRSKHVVYDNICASLRLGDDGICIRQRGSICVCDKPIARDDAIELVVQLLLHILVCNQKAERPGDRDACRLLAGDPQNDANRSNLIITRNL